MLAQSFLISTLALNYTMTVHPSGGARIGFLLRFTSMLLLGSNVVDGRIGARPWSMVAY
jgi:hypothetical protein